MKPSPASHSPAECRLYNFLLLFLFRNYPGPGSAGWGDCPKVWAQSLLGSALVTPRLRHLVSCPAPALQSTLSPSYLRSSARDCQPSPLRWSKPQLPSSAHPKLLPEAFRRDPSWSLDPLCPFMPPAWQGDQQRARLARALSLQRAPLGSMSRASCRLCPHPRWGTGSLIRPLHRVILGKSLPLSGQRCFHSC